MTDKAREFLEAFDDALNVRPHLVLEIGYNRVTDWCVYVFDATNSGLKDAKQILMTQSTHRDEALTETTTDLKAATRAWREAFTAEANPVGAPPSGRPVCTWAQDEDGFYESSCGDSFEFYNDGPAENHFRYCPYCGLPLEQQQEQHP